MTARDLIVEADKLRQGQGLTQAEWCRQAGYDEYGKLKKERAKRLASLPLYPVSEPEQYFPLIGKLFRELGICGKYEITAPDGKKLPALEYRSTPDGKLLYVINWNKAAQKVKLPAGRWHELISETDSPQTFELKPLEVRLFRRKGQPIIC